MNTLSQLSFFGWNHILLQSVASPFQMDIILYLLVAVLVLTLIVVFYIYMALQILVKPVGMNEPLDEGLSIEWVKLLFVLTIGLAMAALYIYSTVLGYRIRCISRQFLQVTWSFSICSSTIPMAAIMVGNPTVGRKSNTRCSISSREIPAATALRIWALKALL
jgi:hypothetical protein